MGLLLWDESVIEKPESIAWEGLCAVRSSKARRLKRIKPGYYNPPAGPPIFVPGMNWLAVLLLGRQGPPTLAAMRWWTTRGVFAPSAAVSWNRPCWTSACKPGAAVWCTFLIGDLPEARG